MLDLLLARAQEASSKLYKYATVMPSPYDLLRVRHSEEYYDLILEAIVYIGECDGRHVLTTRKDDIVMFGQLLSFVLFELQQQRLSRQEYLNLLASKDAWN